MYIRMPEMDGIEATKIIRAAERDNGRPPLPIIALTANSELEQEALAAGFDYFLSKPAGKSQLEEILRSCLKQNKAS